MLVKKADITPELVSRLVATQFPQWAELPVRPVDVDGWDNAMFRLGELMSVRLPSSQAYVEEVEKEHRWLPILAPQLPLPIPEPLAMGKPGCGSRGRGRCTGGSMARQQRPRRWRTCLSSPPTWPTFSPPFTRWTRPAVRQTYYHHGTLENYLDAFQAGGLHLTELTDVLARADAHRQTRIPRPGAFPRFIILAFINP